MQRVSSRLLLESLAAISVIAMGITSLAAPAKAITISVKFINKASAALNTVSIVPKVGGAAQIIVSTAIVPASSQSVTFTPAVSTCVFAVTYTFSSGKTATVPDTDLCQTEQMMVQ